MTLTQKDLNESICASPNCNHEDHAILYLHAVCHPMAGLDARYEKKSGELE